MVGRLLRYRWMWARVAGIVMAGVALAGCQAQQSGTVGNQQPGALLATVHWDRPVLLPGGRSIQVSADVMHLPDYCLSAALPTLRPVVSETATSVTIRVRAYRPSLAPPPTVNACAASGHIPVPVIVQLQRPLGQRNLKDASGDTVPVLDAATVPTPTYLPPGYRQTAFSGSPTTGSIRSYERLPRAADGSLFELRIIQQLPPRQPLYQEQELARSTVLGHPARVVQTGGDIAVQRCVTWSAQPYVWLICAYGGDHPELSAAQLLHIANSLR